MAARFSDTINTKYGTVLPGAILELLNGVGSPVTLYSDPALSSAVGTSVAADNNGIVQCYVPDGTYTVRQSYGDVSLTFPGVELYDQSEAKDAAALLATGKANASALGVAGTASHLGAFTGPAIPANQTTKQALQALASRVNDLLVDLSGLATGMKAFNIGTSPTNTLFSRPSVNVVGGTMLYSATPDYATPKPLEFIASRMVLGVTDRLSIYPTPASHAQGLDIIQSSPASGVRAGPFSFNALDITIRSALTTGGIPGNPGSGTWYGIRSSLNVGGPNYDADSVMGISGGVVQTLPDNCVGDKNGGAFGLQIEAYTPGRGYGASSGMTVTAAGSASAVYGFETDVLIESETVDHVVGFNSWIGGAKTGIYTHTAFAAGSAGGDGQFGNGVAPWKTVLRLYTAQGQTNSPVDEDSVMFDSDHDAVINHVFDFENVTVAGDILKFQNVRLTGDSKLSLLNANACISLGDLPPTNTWLNISPSTATKASLRIQPGVAQTIPISGNIYSTGTHLYWVDGSGIARQLDN